jgi:hypothetical protein
VNDSRDSAVRFEGKGGFLIEAGIEERADPLQEDPPRD